MPYIRVLCGARDRAICAHALARTKPTSLYTNHSMLRAMQTLGGLYKALKQYRMLLQYTVILIISVV